MSMEQQAEQLFILKNKKNAKHENETINLINGSIWDPNDLDYQNFKLENKLNVVHFKNLRGIK